MSEFKEFADAMASANQKLAGLAAVVRSAADVVAIQTRKLNDYWLNRIADAQRALDAANAGAAECQAKIDVAQREHDAAKKEYDAYATKVAEAKRQARGVIAEAEASMSAE
jgi:hypothetical protein